MTQFKCECCNKVFDLDKAVVIPNPAGSPIYICETCDGTTNNHKRFAMCSECLAVKDTTKGVFVHDNEHSCNVFTCDECVLKSCPHVSPEQLDNMKKDIPPSENTCVCCGEVIPEGRQVCPSCMEKNGLHVDEFAGAELLKRTVVYERDSNPVDIHKIIDDAMEKRDRTVSIYIGEAGVSVNVYPVDHDKVCWIRDRNFKLKCSNCGHVTTNPNTYCGFCGELMHGVKTDIDVSKLIKKTFGGESDEEEN